MPYNPGVQDIRGQLLGQGITTAANSIASGLKTYAQNKQLASDALGKFEGAAQADSQAKQANPQAYPGDSMLEYFNKDSESDTPSAATSAYQKLQRDGTLNYRDAAVLAQFASSYSDRQQQQSMLNVRNQQAAEYAARVSAQQRQAVEAASARAALQSASQPIQTAGTNGVSDASLFAGSPFAGAVQQAQPSQTVQPSMADIATRFAQSGAPMTPEVERFLAQTGHNEELKTYGDTRITTAQIQADQRAAAAEGRAQAAESKLTNAQGEFKTVGDAYKAGLDAVGNTGGLPEVVPMPGGTYGVKITKPYVAKTDPVDNAIAKLQDAQDEMDMAVASKDPKQIASAQTALQIRADRAKKLSQFAPDRTAEIMSAIGRLGSPAPAPAAAAPAAPAQPVAPAAQGKYKVGQLSVQLGRPYRWNGQNWDPVQ